LIHKIDIFVEVKIKKAIKIFSLILVMTGSLFFIAGQSLDYFVFKYRQTVIRKEIKKQIKNGVEESELFVFSYTKIHSGIIDWVKQGKEFRKDGSMYDIVHLDFKDGEWFYQCVDDSQEAKLFVELDQLVKNRMNGNSSDDYMKNLIKDFVKVYFETEKTVFLSLSKKEKTEFHFTFPHFLFDILSPPPQKRV
jgi:hypothetical protein